MADIHQILSDHWGYSTFRPLQEDIIQSVITGKDTIGLLPTGGGKSICYQVPGLALPGMTIVISPLIALITDQVEGLKSKGISAISITSSLSFREIDIILDNAISRQYKFLFVSPERLKSDLFIQRLKRMPVDLFAIDEAHCISEWGHDFRPSYLEIAQIRYFHPKAPVLALTATATPTVVKDITKFLELQKPVLFQKSFARSNIFFNVESTTNKLEKLYHTLNQYPGVGIVYVRSRKGTRDIAEYLKSRDIEATYYHAGLTHEERHKKQADWIQNRCRIIVATNAFGMGIDKADVRIVVHYEPPETLENYYQEAGRAGRDGKDSAAVLLFSSQDLQRLRDSLADRFPPVKTLQNTYTALGNYYQLAVGSGKHESFTFDFQAFCANYGFPPRTTHFALALLEKSGLISVQETTRPVSSLKATVNSRQLYSFQVSQPKYATFIQFLLRKYPGLFEQYITINEYVMAKQAELPVKQVFAILRYLKKLKLVDYQERSTQPSLIWLEERIDSKNISADKIHYALRKKVLTEKIESVLQYCNRTDQCRTKMILTYFGEGATKDCGNCDYCLSTHKSNKSLSEELLERISTKGSRIMALQGDLKTYSANEIIQCIRQLIESGRVVEKNGMIFPSKKTN